MIFPESIKAKETVETGSPAVGISFAFDYATNTFCMVDGSPRQICGVDAVQQWLGLLVRTIPGKCDIYDQTFGVDVTKLIGRKEVPSGALLSEVKREITEGAALCPAIDSVTDFRLSGDTVSFTVTLKSGEESEVSIEL